MDEMRPKEQSFEQDELIQAMSERLRRLMEDEEVQKISYTALIAYRMMHWAASELSAVSGVTPEIQKIIFDAQQRKAMEPFNLQELVSSLTKRHLRWMRKREREYAKVQVKRDAQFREIERRLKREDIPLPVHSMKKVFGDELFRHGDTLLVFGPRKALSLVARWCAMEYERVGGVAALLHSEQVDTAHAGIASYRIPPSWYANAANSSSDLAETLLPGVKPIGKPAAGLLVVSDLDQLLLTSQLCQNRVMRIYSAFAELQQFQYSELAAAMIVCVATDDDLPESDLQQTYPQLMLNMPHVQVRFKKSEIDGAGERELLCVGNDVISVAEIEDKLKAKETEE